VHCTKDALGEATSTVPSADATARRIRNEFLAILLVPQVALFADSYIFRMALYGDTRRIDFLSVGFPMLINF